jgi:uncharacterized membrane protein
MLLISTVLNRKIKSRDKTVLLSIFGAALVVSHYSVSYIFLFCILFTFIATSIADSIFHRVYRQGGPHRERPIRFTFVAFIFALSLAWYFVVTPYAGAGLVAFIRHVANSFITGFTNVDTSGPTVSEFISPNFGDLSLLNKTEYVVNKAPYLFIFIGFIELARKSNVAQLEPAYLLMALANILMLVMVLVVPVLAPAFLAERFYHVSLLFLAPISIHGGEVFIRRILSIL